MSPARPGGPSRRRDGAGDHTLRTDAASIVPERFLWGPSRWGRSPGLVARYSPPSVEDADRVSPWLAQGFPDAARHGAWRDGDAGTAIVAVADLFLRVTGLGAGPSGVVTRRRDGSATIFIAAARPDAALVLAAGLERLAQVASNAQASVPLKPLSQQLLADLVRVRDLQREASRLYAAARARGVPAVWLAWPSGGLAIGEGSARHLYHHGVFDSDAALTSLAHNKLAAARLLEQAGVPTTCPVVVTSSAEAAAHANEIGYPVVVKPACGWAQVGVWTGLKGPGQVRHAFQRAQAQAGPLLGPMLLERHRSGRNIRVTVIGGTIAGAYASDDPVVTGDGIRTAGALARAFYGLDDDAVLDARSAGILEATLCSQELTADSVPAAGRRVRIGLASQNHPTDVTCDLPEEVLTIARRVAALFPLPVVGIDLLVRCRVGPRSRRTAVVVVEVNPGPAFAEHERAAGAASRDLAHSIIEHLFPDSRAAFVPVLAATPRAARRLAGVAAALRERSVWPVGYSRRTTWSGDPGCVVGCTPASAGLLAIDARAHAILFEVDAALMSAVGLPACHVDAWLSGGVADGPAVRLLSSLCPSDPLDALNDADVADLLMSTARQGVTLHAW